MSIISWTSPSPSWRILPHSRLTRRPSASFSSRSTSPNKRASSPRRGGGTGRQARKAARAPPNTRPPRADQAAARPGAGGGKGRQGEKGGGAPLTRRRHIGGRGRGDAADLPPV